MPRSPQAGPPISGRSGRPAQASRLLDDVRIYDRALSPGELLALPGPSQGRIFVDGFESGDLSGWDSSSAAPG